MKARLLCLSSLVACIVACNEQSPPPPAARFDRPNRVAFLCARDADILALDACSTPPKDKSDTIALFALVTQAGRGEVAAVNLRRRRVIDTRREIPGFTYQPVGEAPVAVVVPADADHASHTYVASFGSRDVRVVRTRTLVATVDEEPLAQTVALTLPETGERVSPTSMVLTPDERALVVGVPEAGRLLVLPLVRCAEGTVDCEDGLIDEAKIRSVDLSASAGRIADLDAIEPAHYQQLCGYERADLPKLASIVMADGALDATPRPSALTVDPYCAPDTTCTPRLLVADDALPLVHVLDLTALLDGDDPVLAPLVTGVPTSAVAVTPHVPRAVGDDEGSTQYVYAIDATDGSVMVLEGGFVLEVNADPTLRPDRIALGATRSAARSLTVLTPTFKVDGAPNQQVSPDDAPENLLNPMMCHDDEHQLEEPARLRGVFLAVATSEGLVHIVDVHDMELLSDVEGEGACRECAKDEAVPVVIRHHQRLATGFVSQGGEPAPPFTPELERLRFIVDQLSFQVRVDGTTASPAAPGLECMKCDDGRTKVYPTVEPSAAIGDGGVVDGGVLDVRDGATPEMPEMPVATDGGLDAAVPIEDVVIIPCPENEPALVCASGDPWAAPEDVFVALYEGRVPGASAALGRFATPTSAENRTGGLELLTELDACARGVLGEEDMLPDYEGCDEPPDRSDGDQVVLVSRPLGSAGLGERLKGRTDAERVRNRCTALAEALDDEDLEAPVAFEIRRAYDDRLVLNDTLITSVAGVRSFGELADCYESPVSFEVRSYHAFTVTTNSSGFAHRVRANAAGRCQIDPDGDPLMRGRARAGCTFTNHTFQLRFAADRPERDTRFEIGVGSRARKLTFDATQAGYSAATVVTTDLAFNPIDEKLYLVDISDRGLLPIGVDPLPAALSSSYQYR
jgi:hypothetical protein